MPVFICSNSKCSRCGKRDIETRVKYIADEEGNLVADKAPCPECGEERNEEKENPTFIVNVRNSTKRKWSKSSKGTLY